MADGYARNAQGEFWAGHRPPISGHPGLNAGTEGIKYSGSKRALLPHIMRVIDEIKPNRVFDGFSGSTRVSQGLANAGITVVANDRSVWSRVFAECYLLGAIVPSVEEKIAYLNALPGRDGWFTEHYGGQPQDGSAVQPDGKKRVWQSHNTARLDAIRPEIDRIAETEIEKSVLITSLIMALDKVDNTLGHFASYLSKWSPRSYNEMRLRVPKFARPDPSHKIHCDDIFSVLPIVTADLAYFDPPYGSNNEKMPPSRVRYASYYHLWTTVCLNDQPPLIGAANRRVDAGDAVSGSVFEEFRRNTEGRFLATEAIARLLKEADMEHVLLSYSDGGRATKAEISDAIDAANGTATIYEINHRRNVMSAMRWTHDWVKAEGGASLEYLFAVRK